MTIIDVNTGTFVGYRNQEETVYKTNLEATQIIARQLCLRNLGGIIIDFIDTVESYHRNQVLNSLKKYLSFDYAKIQISEITSLGLVQLTRKRTTESLKHILCSVYDIRRGHGQIKPVETICYDIRREILRSIIQFNSQQILVVVATDVVDKLLDDKFTSISAPEKEIEKEITFQVEKRYQQNQYNTVPL